MHLLNDRNHRFARFYQVDGGKSIMKIGVHMKKQNHTLSIILGILAGGLTLGNLSGWPIPLAGDNRTALIALGFLGMALCSQGIGRIAEDHRWKHPISLLGIVIGAINMILWINRLLGFSLPYASTDSQAILTMGVLMGSKFILARSYAFFRRFPRLDSSRMSGYRTEHNITFD